MQRTVQPYLVTGIAVLSAGFVTAPVAAPRMDVRTTPVHLASGENIAFIVGGSGDPIPGSDYVDTNNELYIQPLFPGYDPQALYTPEGNYALYTGVKSLTLDESEAQGATIMKNAIEQQVAAGNHVAILGDSQSSTISSMVMSELAADNISKDDVAFVLLADPNQPDGGLFERLAGVTIPSLGITFNGATPDDLYPTTIYMQAYDGFSDVPRYPINFLADLNSILGIEFVHPTYQGLTAEQLASAVQLGTAGDTSTTYYGIPLSAETVPYLPLLQPLLFIPGLGKPLADLLEPILTPLVNLGYGDPDFGWDTGPANVPTPFGLFPDFDMVIKAVQESAAGVQQGFQAFTDDLGSLSLSSLSNSAAPDVLSGFNLTDIVNSLTAAFSTGYAALLPTADVITALTATVPTYDLQWFTQALQDGNLLQAVLEPLANNTYMYTLAAGFEAFSLISTFESISADLSGLFPG